MAPQKFHPSAIIPIPMRPTLTLLVKLGSIAVHVDEMMSPAGHDYDKIALKALLDDPEVKDWIKNAGPMLPQKRS